MRFVLVRATRAILTMIFVVTAVFFASRYSGNPIDIMFPEGPEPGRICVLGKLFWIR